MPDYDECSVRRAREAIASPLSLNNPRSEPVLTNPMKLVPVIGDARPVSRTPLATGKHTAVLLDDIESLGPVKYQFILLVFDDRSKEPCLFVASEVNETARRFGGGSHFLGLFAGETHSNYGSSDDWSDIGKFEQAALKLALQHLSSQVTSTSDKQSFLTYEEYLSLVRELTDYLSAFIIAGDSLMKVQYRGIDFPKHRKRLSQIHETGLRLKNTLFPHVNQVEGTYAINSAITFIDCLLASNAKLEDICSNLERKASGGKYGFFEYRRDMKDYQAKETARELAGSQLNSACKRPW